MNKILDEIGKAIEKTIEKTWILNSIGVVLIIGIAFIMYFAVKRIKKGDDFSFMKFKLSHNETIEKQRQAFDKLNELTKQRLQIIKILNQLSVENTKYLCSGLSVNNAKAVYACILHMIAMVMKKNWDMPRVAVFRIDANDELYIHEGCGYSTEGKEKLRLSLNNSSAGYVFRTGEIYHSGNVETPGNSYKKNPKSSRNVKSLICVPIKCDMMKLGVLSVDSQENDTFSDDDKDYLVYFANALASFMLIEHLVTGKAGEPHEQIASGEQ
ncbi:GAF domain-containing protein [Gorillibacterium sp. sgz500922]|uniref:GAF domain-containing protein n=1 Tax=Gorillibacterium sp. sgz500922 TaxID=3446694 RepID=UPI003F6790DB